jgi:hypothetical protein
MMYSLLMSTSHTVDWFRSFGPVSATRHSRLHIVRLDRAVWRVLATDDLGDTDITGPVYRTRAEALAALDGPDLMDWRA